MAGDNPDLVVQVAANIVGLQADMTAAAATVTKFEGAVASAALPLQQVENALSDVGATASAAASQLSTAAAAATGPVLTLRGGLNDLAEGAGVTFGEMGLLGSAMLAVGVGMAAFNFTRWVVGFTNIDDAVAKASARLLGFGDVVAQSAGAKQDVMTLAIKRGADAAITYADALKFNAEWFVDWQQHAKDMDDVAARIHAPAELAEQMGKWNAEINLVRAAGALPALTEGINSHVISVKELAASYRISEGAVNLFKQQLAEDASAIKAHNAAILATVRLEVAEKAAAAKLEAKALEETTKLWDAYYALRVDHGGTANEIAIAGIDKWAADLTARMVKAGTDTTEFYNALAAVSHEKMAAVGIDWDLFRTKSIPALRETASNALATYTEMVASGLFFRKELDAQLAKYHELADSARGMGKDFVNAEEAATEATSKHNAELAKTKQLADAAAAAANRAMGGSKEFDFSTEQSRAQIEIDDPIIAEFLHAGYSLAQAAQLKMGRLYHFSVNIAQKGPRVPGYAGGIDDAPGGFAMVGERGPELMFVPPHASITPHGGTAPGSGTQIIQLVLDGRVLAQVVNDHNTALLRQTRQLPAR